MHQPDCSLAGRRKVLLRLHVGGGETPCLGACRPSSAYFPEEKIPNTEKRQRSITGIQTVSPRGGNWLGVVSFGNLARKEREENGRGTGNFSNIQWEEKEGQSYASGFQEKKKEACNKGEKRMYPEKQFRGDVKTGPRGRATNGRKWFGWNLLSKKGFRGGSRIKKKRKKSKQKKVKRGNISSGKQIRGQVERGPQRAEPKDPVLRSGNQGRRKGEGLRKRLEKKRLGKRRFSGGKEQHGS